MKRILCCILIVLMVLQMTYPAFAYTSNTINNSIEENQTILDKLQSMYVKTCQKMISLMNFPTWDFWMNKGISMLQKA